MNWNQLFVLMYNHPFATFFFLCAIAGIVGAANPFNKKCDCEKK